MTLYHIIRPVITLAFRLYFKKIQHFGAEKIPLGKPLIFSVNHPTGFFEPTVLACTFWEHDFYFITRGDMFKKPFYRRILESFFMIPIYRFRDGFADENPSAKKNSRRPQKTFDAPRGSRQKASAKKTCRYEKKL